ncbi:uncharacterized protein LOC132547550 [Ylistrum balloti]|uniref:uncharacterized protein LOC132547550 n=1 Tax=Ylistrum balloti TaxID=509963 RepID=UPI002905E92B|nr:uncharacterized protein LOC132547550 [Ylistrum balloti]
MAETFFDPEKFYEDVPEDGNIPLTSFLEKTRQIIAVLDSFGIVFSPVKSDMQNNIDKITKAMKKPDGGEYHTLKELIEAEEQQGVSKGKNSGTVAAVWLGRGLKFMYLFFEQLVSDKSNTESNTEFVQTAYKGSLQPYHNFMSKSIFTVACRGVPKRSALCKQLMKNPEGKTADEINRTVIDGMREYLKNLKATTDVWNGQCMELTKDKYNSL